MGLAAIFSDYKRVYVTAAFMSLPFLVLVLNAYVDQFFITLQGKTAVFAYTLALPIETMLLATGTVIGTIVAALIRRHLNEGRTDEARSSAIESVYYAVPASIITSLVLYFLLFLLGYFIWNPDVGESMDSFLSPFFYAFLIITLHSVFCGIMVAQGMTKSYVICLLISLGFNVLFDPLYVMVFNMGVFGNGLGTVTGVLIAFCVELFLLTRDDVKVPLRLRYLPKVKTGLANVLSLISDPVLRVVARQVSEFVIRLALYTTFALTYGIPILYASIIGVVGSALSGALSAEFAVHYARKDSAAAYALFKHQFILGFAIMFALAALVSLFSSPLASVFTTHITMGESQEMMEWTIGVICFSAPFLGLRSMCASVYANTEWRKLSLIEFIVWQGVRVVLFVSVLTMFGFQVSMYYLILERIITCAVSVFAARQFILQHYSSQESSLSDIA